MEKWEKIPLFDDRYEVSNMGKVRGWYYGGHKRKTPKIKTNQKNKNGYWYVVLQSGKLVKAYTIHRLVLSVFDKQMPKNIDCCHKDGNKDNNKLSNLKWGTRKENEADKKRHGKTAVGEKNGLSKMNESQIIEIRKLHKSGMSTNAISKIFNSSQQNIWHIVNLKTWKHL